MDEEKTFLDLDDLYIAAYLSLHRIRPEIVRENGGRNHVVFRVPRNPHVNATIVSFSVDNPSVGARDFAGAIRALRARMIQLKHRD